MPERQRHGQSLHVSRFTFHAFSLIELLIVMVLMILMYVMLYGPGTKSHQREQKAACARNLQMLYVALKIYAAEHENVFPAQEGAATPEAVLSRLVPKYTTDTGFFICPGSGDKKLPPAQPFEGRKISYSYYMGRKLEDGGDQPLASDEQVDSLEKAKGAAIFSLDGKPPGNNHRKYGGVVLFCDGRAIALEPRSDRDLQCPEGVTLLNPKP